MEHNRWWFLISSRPLTPIDFLRDSEVLNESQLPPLFEFDTLYQYYAGDENDKSAWCGKLPVSDIHSIRIQDATEVQSGFPWLIDCGKSQLALTSVYRFEMERWIEAITISMQTAREGKLSLTGSNKNVSKIICQFDLDKDKLKKQWEKDLQKRLPLEIEEWSREVEPLLAACSVVRDDLIETIDSCLSSKP